MKNNIYKSYFSSNKIIIIFFCGAILFLISILILIVMIFNKLPLIEFVPLFLILFLWVPFICIYGMSKGNQPIGPTLNILKSKQKDKEKFLPIIKPNELKNYKKEKPNSIKAGN
jgi:hypothetical protein